MASNEESLVNIFASDFVKHTKEDMQHIAQTYMRICFRIYEADKNKYYEALGYPDISSCCEAEFDISKSTASRMINICKRFSVHNGGVCSMFIDNKYKDFNYSQLCELVSMKDKDIRLIKPDMSVKKIRDIKNNIRSRFSDTVELSKRLSSIGAENSSSVATSQLENDDSGATSHQMTCEEYVDNITNTKEDESIEVLPDDEICPEVCDPEEHKGCIKKDIKGLTKKDIKNLIETEYEDKSLFSPWLLMPGVDEWYYRKYFHDGYYVIMYDMYFSEIKPSRYYIFYGPKDLDCFDFDAAELQEKDFINNLFWELTNEKESDI